MISWFASVSSIIWNSESNFIINIGVTSFSIFLIITLSRIKLQSVIIILFLLLIYILTINKIPTKSDLFNSGKYILIFAGLIPTMGLVKSTAQRLPHVKRSQMLLSELPKDSFSSGFQITAHFFGAVINTGVFAMLAAAMPPGRGYAYRKTVAEASLRGMSSSATWSPFFVAFVVGQIYIGATSAWFGLAIGLIMSLIFSIVSVLLLNRELTRKKFKKSLACLQPVVSTLLIIILFVVGSAIVFGLTALSAVIIVMPIMVSYYFFINPKNIFAISIDTLNYLEKSTDDVVIISVAMIVGYFVTNSPDTLTAFRDLSIFTIPNWSVLIFIPVTMALVSLIGIHPVISSTILLSTFTSSNFDISGPLMMQAHLLGWCTGTMSSIASLSVISCSTLFQISSSKLCYGNNSFIAISFALFGGIILSIANEFIRV